ncbi:MULTISPECIES: helix-turn-helix transcriptional regulator [Kribbella]|uniref:DNA-binding transcriptional ArsR family regulator n=1 Tax=Kribbella pratensis TaxID=2512112 RepID=A0ABY2FD68_9ACTN|nr:MULTISPECIES: winged helix-turn-helix domain-containing protein [Kribbella]TDW81271.1 DNA-binding transcriptional ArsR family regulator [Kribbella sp. VKM Ac-2566]TDW88434.1 DNA-binding transcriptional ArsR family regulator [Kribbella pratensis]
MDGDADVAQVAGLMAEPARAKVLMALADGRALPASLLATEAGVSPQTVSAHLRKLLEGGLVTVEQSGRHRYYGLSGPEVAAAVEALARIAKPQPIRSLRQSTRAAALREARTCYDHLAGRLGVALLEGLVRRDALTRTDGGRGTERRPSDPLAQQLPDGPYALGPNATEVLTELGVDIASQPSRRPLLRFCVDWSEQRHHLSGQLGAAITEALLNRNWLHRRPRQRAVHLSEAGRHGLAQLL